jgi:hypothetical protein
MIQPRGSAFISLTSIQPDNRVMTMGAVSEDLRVTWGPLWLAPCIDVVVEFVIAFYLSFRFSFSDF